MARKMARLAATKDLWVDSHKRREKEWSTIKGNNQVENEMNKQKWKTDIRD